MNVETLINILPADGSRRLIRKRQSMDNIIDDLLYKHEKNEQQCNKIAKFFWKGNARDTAKFLFDFCKDNIDYKVEKTLEQSVRSIGRILIDGKGDCKHYASLIVGICCALRRMGYPIKAKYRFAVYPEAPRSDGAKSGHVFAVVMDRQGNEYWTDPVLKDFNQRYPQYISHQDKVPAMGSSNIGEVWELNGIGFGNQTTLAGMPNGVTLGAMRVTKDERGTLIEQDGAVGYLNDYFGGHHHRHNLLNTFIDSPMNPLHPGIPMPGSANLAHYFHRGGHHGHHGRAAHHQPQVFTPGGGVMPQGYAPASMIRHADRLVAGMDDIGKAKHHLKIKPGQFLKKAVLKGSLAPNRNAFLLYLKLNLFHTGSRLWEKAYGKNAKPEAKRKLEDFWKKIGGNPNKLHTALTQAMHVWNKHHGAHKVSGMDNMQSGGHLMYGVDDDMGVVQVAIPAVLAAAAPIIKMISSLLKSFGIGGPKKGDLDQADKDLVDDHNNATAEDGDGNKDIQEDGSVDHGSGIKTKVHIDKKTGKQTIEVKGPDTDGDEEPASDQEEEDGSVTKTKTITKTKTKHGHSDGGGGIGEFWEKTKDFFSEHKGAIIGVTVAAVVGIIVVPRIIAAVKGGGKKRR